MELRILLFATMISFATGQVTMAISKRKTTLGSPVELVCQQPDQGWESDWNRDGQPALTVKKTRENPCVVKWFINTPANTNVICQENSGRFLLRFNQSRIELNGTIWDCKIDDSDGSNSVTIELTEEKKASDTTTAGAVIGHTKSVCAIVGCFLLITASVGVIIIYRKHCRARQSETRTLTNSHGGTTGRTTNSLVMQENDLYEQGITERDSVMQENDLYESSKEHDREHTTEIYTEAGLK
ncbi:uncharacterized protein LOC124256821 [Haliotis rubra]|uniref:uncharacterized protein LOC124256821 n=1 Tax=Haliotis rubra TaxID=36100 RepID=UPI001EE5ABC8|nr:uncharacterized protein LOC124256821 [Haliotis rubra]